VGFSAVYLLVIYILFFLVVLVLLNSIVNSHFLKNKGIQKKMTKEGLEKRADPEDKDPLKKIESLLTEAVPIIQKQDYANASVIYVKLNELYSLLPKEKKRDYFRKIVRIHQELEKMNKKKRQLFSLS
jgi:hypothetical protein